MTAEELAEQIEKHAQLLNNLTDFPKGVRDIKDSATMLREQAAKLRKYEMRNIAQCDRIAILEAQVYGGTTK